MPKIFILIVIVIIIAGGIFWWQKDNINNLFFGGLSKACTQEAKLCSDGSYVGRTGPNCEFAACPQDETADWQTYRNEEYGFEVKYPEKWKMQEYEYKFPNELMISEELKIIAIDPISVLTEEEIKTSDNSPGLINISLEKEKEQASGLLKKNL